MDNSLFFSIFIVLRICHWYSSGQKSRPQMISAIIGLGYLKICVHILRQECRSETQFGLDCFSIKRIMIDGTYFSIELFNLEKNCLFNFALLFIKYMINSWCFCMKLEFSLWFFFTQKMSSFTRILAFLDVYES